jgi:post-segregation antitoxin (ccd killing protein)
VELVLWAICAQRYLPTEGFRPIVYFVGEGPTDLVDWLKSRNLDVRLTAPLIPASPHCNKIAPFFDEHHAEWVAVTDADLFFLADPSGFFQAPRFRAPPNNHCNPPPEIFRSLLSAALPGRPYRPGFALYRGRSGIRETHINNISAGFVAAPAARSRELAETWKKWALWLIENRNLMSHWAVHVDQVGFALAMEDFAEDVEFLPPHTNTILQSLEEMETPIAVHLTTGHIPLFPRRFNTDRTLRTDGLPAPTAQALMRLNTCISEAVEVIQTLPSTKDHFDKFLNPEWKR